MLTTKARDPGEDNVGTRVHVVQVRDVRDYEPVARANCGVGKVGRVFTHSNSHGVCYGVRHEDGTTAWYEPDELEAL